MKYILLTLYLLLVSTTSVFSQSANKIIVDAIDVGDWRTLRETYFSIGKRLEPEYLSVLSRFFIYHFYNQPDSAIHCGTILLNDYQPEISEYIGNVMYFMADDYAKFGEYEYAADILNMYNSAVEQANLEENNFFINSEHQYRFRSKYKPFEVIKPSHDVVIPMTYCNDKSNELQMIFVPIEINGLGCQANYDTGAGVNVISYKMANKIGAHITETNGVTLLGIASHPSKFAIVDSIKLGEITYRNIPFQVIDFETGDKIADKKMEEIGYQCILGNQSMFPLEEIHFNFKEKKLIIPHKIAEKTPFAPNMYKSESDLLILSIFDKISGKVIDGNLDTGANVAKLTSKYFKCNKSLFSSYSETDTLKVAGIGGVTFSNVFSVSWDFEAGGMSHTEPSILVDTNLEIKENYDCLFGLPLLMQYNSIILNFKDMWVKFLDE